MPVLFSPSFSSVLGFKVNTMDHNSSINFGPTCLIDLTTFSKASTGSGSSFGDFAFEPEGFSLVIDPDVIDTPESKAGTIL